MIKQIIKNKMNFQVFRSQSYCNINIIYSHNKFVFAYIRGAIKWIDAIKLIQRRGNDL